MEAILNISNNILHYWYIVPIVVAIFYCLYTSIVVVGGDEIVMLERRWFGYRIPQGRIFAMRNEVGIQARVLTPGLHFLLPFLYKSYKDKLLVIGANQVGIVESVDGDSIETGHIFAKVVEGHNSFQDGEMFLGNGGQKGTQIEMLPPGSYRINKKMFKVTLVDAVIIEESQVGLVVAEDGIEKSAGSLFAKPVFGHNSFQDGKTFLANHGGKGLQLEILTPGTYRLNTALFKITRDKATYIPVGKVGVVTAKDGIELPKDEVVAIKIDGHNSYQNAVKFLENNGQRGPQLELLPAGKYFINTFAFDVEIRDQLEIPVGHVGVVTSSTGKLPSEEIRRQMYGSQVKNGNLENIAQETYVVPDGYRGISDKYLTPGTYFVNPLAYKVDVVPTTNITVDWDDTNDTRFDALKVISKDGFEIKIAVKVIARVLPEQAPFMVSKSGNLENLIHSVVNPNVDASFRNQASSASAMEFLQDRSNEQAKAEILIRDILAKYHVECVSVLVVQIELPKDLMGTQTAKIIAEQQKVQYFAETNAEQERGNREKQTATANQQSDLVRAEISVKVAEQEKQRQIKLAEAKSQVAALEGQGEKDKITLMGEGEAAKIEKIGEATAKAYKAQTEAVGKDQLYAIELIKQFSSVLRDNPNIKLVPDVVVSGSGDNAALQGLFAQLTRVFPNVNVSELIKNISHIEKE